MHPLKRASHISNSTILHNLLNGNEFYPVEVTPLPEAISEALNALPGVSKPYWPRVAEIEEWVENYFSIPIHFMAMLLEIEGTRKIYIYERGDWVEEPNI